MKSVSRVAFVAHSFGALLAAHYAVRDLDEVAAAVLADHGDSPFRCG